MGFLDFLFKKKNVDNENNKNKGEVFEESLLNKYGECKTYTNFGLKILFITDTHNCLAYTDKYLNELKSLYETDYDLCLILGDLSRLDIDEIKRIIPNEKLYGIVGNHDSLKFLETSGVKDINGKVITCKGVKIAAIMGSNKYKDGDYGMQTQEESILLSENMEEADILISHDKKFDYNKIKDPAHQGLIGITDYLFKNKIPVHIHGHLHEETEEILRNGTKSICLYQVKLLEI